MPTITSEDIEAYIKLGESLKSHGVSLEELTLMTTPPFDSLVGVKLKELALEVVASQQRALPLFNPGEVAEPPLSMRSIKELYLGEPMTSRLQQHGIYSLEQLTSLSSTELLALRGMEPDGVDAIIGRLSARNLSLREVPMEDG